MSEQTDEQPQETSAMKQLRQAHERAKAGEEKWRGIALKGLANQAGLDPKAKVTGLLLKEFEAQLGDDDPDVEAITAFAVDYGVTPQAAKEEAKEETPADDDKSDQLNRFQQEVEGVGKDVTGGIPDGETDPTALANQQLANGDVNGSIATKFNALRATSTQE